MYLRTTTRRASDGSVVRYVQLAHNRRVGGVTRARVLANLGREEHLDVAALRRLVASIRRRLGDDPAGAPAVGHARDDALPPVRVVDVRSVGAVWLLDGLWRALGIDRALAAGAPARRWTRDAERVAFACAAVRAVEPAAELSVHEWVGRCVVVPGLERLTVGEVPAVTALVAVTDLDVRLGPVGPDAGRPPSAVEPFRTFDDRVRFGDRVLGWLAATLVATVEHRTGLRWPVVRAHLDRIARVTLAGPLGETTTVCEVSDDQRELLAACGVGLPSPALDRPAG